MDTTDETVSSAVYRFSVRLLPFWPDRPAVWFAQAEVQFELAGITRQRTKFNYVVSQLNQQQAAKVEDIITSLPEQEPYDWLKAELVRQLSTSREQCVRQLLSHEEMGDQTPSQFLRHLKSLAPDVPHDFLRTIWVSRLPPHVQAILAGQTEGSLDSASHIADRICEVTSLPTTASISPSTPDNTARLLERIEELSRQVASLRASETHSRPHSRVANVCTTRSCHLFIMDCYSKQRYLVDTGSDLCVFPRRLLPGRRERTDYTLYAANGTTIPTYGWASRSLNLGPLRLHIVFRDSGRGPTHHRGGPAIPLWTPRRLQEQPPAWRGHITAHARSHCTTISPQRGSHRRKHAPRQPPGGIPGADQASMEPPWGPAQHNA